MAWLDEFPGMAAAGEQAERVWRLPIGAASPLWAAFGAAAGAGVAYWWLTQWTRAVNIEALTPLPPAMRIEVVVETGPSPEPASFGAPEIETPAAPPAELDTEAAPPRLPTADDLTRMVGIGPKLANALAERGVTRFADIAAWTEADLAELDAALSLKGRAVREAWVEQAKKLNAER